MNGYISRKSNSSVVIFAYLQILRERIFISFKSGPILNEIHFPEKSTTSHKSCSFLIKWHKIWGVSITLSLKEESEFSFVTV